MSRIRSIKPEFWTDEKIVKLPLAARLMFIGLWNFCDDEGWLTDEPDRIQMQVFPGDDLDAGVLVDVLVAAGLLDRVGSDDGEAFLVVRNFAEHQRVSNATPSKLRPRGAQKLVIPVAVRRGLAKKYGVEPGDYSHPIECFYCGEEGRAWWPNTGRGKPGSWVGFSLEIDHLQAECEGGSTSVENLVLACRSCNRSKGSKNLFAFSLERSGEVPTAPEKKPRNGMEGKGREGSREEQKTPPTRPVPTAGDSDCAQPPAAGVGPASPPVPPAGPRIARRTDADLRPWFDAVCLGLDQQLSWGHEYVLQAERIVAQAERHKLSPADVRAIAGTYRGRCRDGTPSLARFVDAFDRWRAEWLRANPAHRARAQPADLRAQGRCPDHPGEKLDKAGRCGLCDEVEAERERLRAEQAGAGA